MKKAIALTMALAMMLTLFAGCGKSEPVETAPAQQLPASALEILETVWANYADDEKFAIIGGNIEANIMDAPGNYDLTYAENMTWNLLVPADRIGDVAEAASMIHMMNANNFTCGVFHVTGNANDFAKAMADAVKNNQWMCGMPETMNVSVIGGEYVLMAFGINDAMNPFTAKLAEAYPAAETVASGPVA